jgi:putative hemolysin
MGGAYYNDTDDYCSDTDAELSGEIQEDTPGAAPFFYSAIVLPASSWSADQGGRAFASSTQHGVCAVCVQPASNQDCVLPASTIPMNQDASQICQNNSPVTQNASQTLQTAAPMTQIAVPIFQSTSPMRQNDDHILQSAALILGQHALPLVAPNADECTSIEMIMDAGQILSRLPVGSDVKTLLPMQMITIAAAMETSSTVHDGKRRARADSVQ